MIAQRFSESLAVALVALPRVRARAALSAKVRVRLYRKLAGLVRTGLPVPRAIDAVWQLTTQGGRKVRQPLALAVGAWRQAVYDGLPVGSAMAGWVPTRETMILDAGASDLPRALEDASLLVETSHKMTAAVVGAAIYPGFLAMLLCGLLWIFSARAIPAFAQIRPVEEWTGAAAGLGWVSHFVHHGLVFTLLALAAIFGGVCWSLSRWTGEWRTRFDRIPPWSLYKLLTGTSFFVALAAFLRAGVPLPEALRRLEIVAEAWLRERIAATSFYVASGHDLGEALHLSGHDFPSREIVDDLRIHASLGGIEESLRKLCDIWVKESLETIAMLSDLAKLAGMALMAGAISWVQFGIIAVQRQLTGG